MLFMSSQALRTILATLTIVAATAGLASAQQADDAPPPQTSSKPAWRASCPGAAAWIEANSTQDDDSLRRRDSQRVLSRPELLRDLEQRFQTDQTARRKLIAGGYSKMDWRAVSDIDVDNAKWLVSVLQKFGFPTAQDVGEYGLHLLWLLFHHADQFPRLQEVALPAFEERWKAGELPANDLARLTDRILVKHRKPQMYGTQHDWGAADLQGQKIDHLDEIELNRQRLGLMPLVDYGCMMHQLRKPVRR